MSSSASKTPSSWLPRDQQKNIGHKKTKITKSSKSAKSSKKNSAAITKSNISADNEIIPVWEVIKPFDENFHMVESAFELISHTLESKNGLENKYKKMPVEDVLKMAATKLMLLKDKTVLSVKRKRPSTERTLPLSKEQCRQLRPLHTNCRAYAVARILKASSSTPKRINYAIPPKVLAHYEKLTYFLEARMLRKLLRPQIYFDLRVRTKRFNTSLGRIVFQLFTEACPSAVLEFVRCCAANQHKRLKLKRISRSVWLELALSMGESNVLDTQLVEHDLNILSHNQSSGILSFPLAYLENIYSYKALNFTVSLSPLELPKNGRRLAFGVVDKGQWLMNQIEKSANKFGKPVPHVYVAKCGVLNSM